MKNTLRFSLLPSVLCVLISLSTPSSAKMWRPDVDSLVKNSQMIAVIRVDKIVPKHHESIEYSLVSVTVQDIVRGKTKSRQIKIATDANMETDDRKVYQKGHRYLVFLRPVKSDYVGVYGRFGAFEIMGDRVQRWPSKLRYPTSKSGEYLPVGPEVLGPYKPTNYERVKKDILHLAAHQHNTERRTRRYAN